MSHTSLLSPPIFLPNIFLKGEMSAAAGFFVLVVVTTVVVTTAMLSSFLSPQGSQ